LSLVLVVDRLQRDGDGIGGVRRSIVVGGGLVGLEADESSRIERLEPQRRAAHNVEEKVVDARLVEDGVRKL